MDMALDRTSMVLEEDRISNLSNDIIYRILSFVDMKDAIQTSQLSRRWRHIWTSMPHLNFDTREFRHLPQFEKFMKHALSHRNNSALVSSVNLSFRGAMSQSALKSIIKYAFSHNVEQLTMRWYAKEILEFSQCVFSSHTLKILTLTGCSEYTKCFIPEPGWDFPSLETLNLTNINLTCGTDQSLNPFSKCVNLKNLTLDRFQMDRDGIFIINAPQLSNLTITNAIRFPKVINVVAPQLLNLTASLNSSKFSKLQLLTEGFISLEKVQLCCSPFPEINVALLLDLFHKFGSAKVLILDKHIIEAISSHLNKFPHEVPCPFNNLECLKVYGVSRYPTRAKNYLLENSPNATFIMDSPPQVRQKRSRKPEINDGMANKVAKLDAENKQTETTRDKEKTTMKEKIQTQDEVIAELRAKIQVMETTYEKLIPDIIKCKMAELKVQVESGKPDYEVIHLMGCEIKSLIDLIPKSSRLAMESHFSARYKEVKHQSCNCINATQWAIIETLLGYLTDSKIQVLTTDAAPTSSSPIMATSSEEGAK